MNKLLRVALLPVVCAAAAVSLSGCGKSTPIALTPAPPGPADLGPAAGLSTPPAGAVVFDLKYRAQTGGAEDIPYNSFWGYGGGQDEETKTNAFLAEVRQKASHLYYVCNSSFTGRKWAAVEFHGRQASALYFDLNADGKFEEDERILPTRQTGQGVEFITPDFMQSLAGGGQTFCRVLLQVNFYQGSSEPNCMWSPAALMEGAATLEGRPARLLLFANSPGGRFDEYAASDYALQLDDQMKVKAGIYLPREALSSLIATEDRFYHLTLDGRRSNGLPARVVLVKDTSPTGALAMKSASSNSLRLTLTSLYLRGTADKTVYLHMSGSKDKVTLPEGTYAMQSGTASYGISNANEWQVSFTQGPQVMIKAGETIELPLGQPILTVRAIAERDRYNSKPAEKAVFKPGERIYLEPKIVGSGGELFSRFSQKTNSQHQQLTDRPPQITITGPNGKPVLSQVMEYG